MHIVIILLVAILIVLIGGPIALGAAVALPAWLMWSTGVFQAMFWVVVIGGGLAALAGVALLVIKIIEPKTPMRSCTQCGHRQPADMRFCFKCSSEHATNT